jgi:hypothetical protein
MVEPLTDGPGEAIWVGLGPGEARCGCAGAIWATSHAACWSSVSLRRFLSARSCSKTAGGFMALRISAGCDGGEQLPVGSAGVEECPDAVVAEAPESEGDSFGSLDEVVHRFGGSVRHA